MNLSSFHSLPIPLVQLSLAAVLKCGQSFRWTSIELKPTHNSDPSHEWRLCLRDRVVCLRQTPTTLFYRAVFPDPQPPASQSVTKQAETLVWLKDYFQLDVDLKQLYTEWSARDLVFAKLQNRFEGIRMLRQDPWENLISFICSSNNNISRITKMVNSLCEHYSPSLLSIPNATSSSTEAITYHPFPPPSVLAAKGVTEKLRELGFGYRAQFIQRTAHMLVEAHGVESIDATEPSELWLRGLRDASVDDARAELLKFIGVGRKVADCVLLMSLDKRDVVPVDTHVHQIAVKHYGMKSAGGKTNMTPKLYEDVNARLASVWGNYAGWAHSVLFTADLKSFSTYGSDALPLTLPKGKKSAAATTTSSSGVSTLKRALDADYLETEEVILSENISLVERVKRRKRSTKP